MDLQVTVINLRYSIKYIILYPGTAAGRLLLYRYYYR